MFYAKSALILSTLLIPSLSQSQTLRSDYELTRLTQFDAGERLVKSYQPVPLTENEVVYVQKSQRGCPHLWSIQLDTLHKQQLTFSDDEYLCQTFNADPAPLSDGRIVYTSRDRKSPSYNLWILDPRTGETNPLTTYRSYSKSARNPFESAPGKIIFQLTNQYDDSLVGFREIDIETKEISELPGASGFKHVHGLQAVDDHRFLFSGTGRLYVYDRLTGKSGSVGIPSSCVAEQYPTLLRDRSVVYRKTNNCQPYDDEPWVGVRLYQLDTRQDTERLLVEAVDTGRGIIDITSSSQLKDGRIIFTAVSVGADGYTRYHDLWTVDFQDK